jgi:hypothetical protein
VVFAGLLHFLGVGLGGVGFFWILFWFCLEGWVFCGLGCEVFGGFVFSGECVWWICCVARVLWIFWVEVWVVFVGVLSGFCLTEIYFLGG